jgi:FKBP-type peptidyl-prolyl cis-trans isomerase
MLYQGWLTNGQSFDQTRKNEQGQLEPFIFTLGSGQVIPGWEQTIAGMKEGGKRRLIIPASSGYGAVSQGPIPANSMLIFDVELVAVQPSENSGL